MSGPAAPTTRILIADDHAVVRHGLKEFLGRASDAFIGEASNAQETLALVRNQNWSLVILDIAMAGSSGLGLLKAIKQQRPSLPVLMFSMFSEEEFALASLRSGASGYLAKDGSPAEIAEAVRVVATGGRYLRPALLDRLLLGSSEPPEQLPHLFLSKREFEVLLLISRGEPLTRIGDRLNLSVKTISTYRARILDKLGYTTNADLTRYVMAHRLDD